MKDEFKKQVEEIQTAVHKFDIEAREIATKLLMERLLQEFATGGTYDWSVFKTK